METMEIISLQLIDIVLKCHKEQVFISSPHVKHILMKNQESKRK